MPSTAERHSDRTDDAPVGTRRLMVVRQDHQTRRFHVLGDLDVRPDGVHVFSYRDGVGADEGFRPVPGFPDTTISYTSPDLFPFFTNRVMSPRRPDYDAHLRTLGLDDAEATPVEMLVRTGGRRATDTYQIVPHATVGEDGVERRLFLVSGIRYVDGAPEAISRLAPGHHLSLRPDPTNAHDAHAILLDAASGHPVGYVPGYLCRYVSDHSAGGAAVDVVVVHTNGPDVPPHLQLLCRMDVTPMSESG